MKLAVIGAGVVGLSTAFELTADGHDVTVFERHNAAAEGASFAPGGLLAPAWACATRRDQTAQPAIERGLSGWKRWLRPDRALSVNTDMPFLTLMQYSVERLQTLIERHHLTPDQVKGLMVVWRDARHAPLAERLAAKMKEWGADCSQITPQTAQVLEPALRKDTPLKTALVMPQVLTINSRQIALQLKIMAQHLGCRFVFGHDIQGIGTDGGFPILKIAAQESRARFDGVVVCAGAHAQSLLQPLGIGGLEGNATGFSLSAPIREHLDAPVANVHDVVTGITLSRQGQRVRVFSQPHRRPPRATDGFSALYAALDEWFPGAVRLGQRSLIQEWSGAVATTADDLPLMGPSTVPGVWLNTGHGPYGWMAACGSGRLLADAVSGKPAAMDMGPYRPQRFKR